MDTIIISNEELEISNDARVVMLSNAKHPLAGYALCAQPLVDFEEILRYPQNDTSLWYA